MRKIYTTKYNKLSVEVCYPEAGLSAQVEFKHGRMGDGIPSKFITSDTLLQRMIERDPRFGSLFRLEKVIMEEGDEQQQKAPVKKAGKKAKTEKEEEVKPTIVEEVHDLTEAIDYFSATYGKAPATMGEVESLMKQFNLAFPNLK